MNSWKRGSHARGYHCYPSSLEQQPGLWDWERSQPAAAVPRAEIIPLLWSSAASSLEWGNITCIPEGLSITYYFYRDLKVNSFTQA